MYSKTFFKSIFAVLCFIICSNTQSQDRQFYQLNIYTISDKNQEQIIDQYLENALLPALKRQNIEKVGVFKSVQNQQDTLSKIYVLVPYRSLSAIPEVSDALLNDNTYLSAGKAYIQAQHDQPPYHRIETVLLRAFSSMPVLQTPSLKGEKKDRIYELRSYESATEALYRNKVEMFDGGGETALFHQLGFQPVFFGEVISGSRMPNLMYLTTFENMDDRTAHWKAFVASDKWNQIKDLPKYQNNMNHADIWFLYPAGYSDY
ncbi:MAG: NIPSNAP family protein [Bacteroidetes bacterium]|nr:NIPSNAP family protein [Bacteroidota bacterium]